MRTQRQRPTFTLIELLVVIAIMAMPMPLYSSCPDYVYGYIAANGYLPRW